MRKFLKLVKERAEMIMRHGGRRIKWKMLREVRIDMVDGKLLMAEDSQKTNKQNSQSKTINIELIRNFLLE